MLLLLDFAGLLQSPYAGPVVFVMVPALFVIGLLLIPFGVVHERRRAARDFAPAVWPKIDLNDLRVLYRF